MLFLTLRTDKPEAEIGLYEDNEQLSYMTWQAHRELAETIHKKLQGMLDDSGKSLRDIRGIAVYKGPGSFTGLRIGLSAANALAYSLQVPIVGVEDEDSWLQRALEELAKGKNDISVMPEYGAPVHITTPKH
jgi:tRNA threonylcarbamoyladenosine biosynthesis protein TsaB